MLLMIPTVRALEKYQRQRPYVSTGTTHDRYRRHFCIGEMPFEELPSIHRALTVVRALVV